MYVYQYSLKNLYADNVMTHNDGHMLPYRRVCHALILFLKFSEILRYNKFTILPYFILGGP
jgi:hypothetical protein